MDEPAKAPELRREMGFVDLALFVVITSFGPMMVAKAGSTVARSDGPGR